MRIATVQYQATMNASLNTNQSQIAKLMQQLASGDRILLPSDDPIGNVRMSRLNREEALLAQYKDNISTVQTRLVKNETYMSSMVADMQEVRDLMVQASDGSNTPDDLKALVTSLTALRDSIFYTANSKDQEGNYQFSGTATNDASLVVAADGSYAYNGNDGEQKVVVGNGVTQVINVTADGLGEMLTQLNDTITALGTAGDPALEAGMKASITATLNIVNGGMQAMSNKIASFGGMQNIMATLENNHNNVSVSNQTALLAIGSADVAQVATDLSGYNAALKATYQAYAKIGNLSLFDVI